jgi:aromatic ring hydroxylase
MRTGAEYLESLKDDRNIWLNGERVADVTAHPVLRRTAEAVAGLFDLQHDSQHAGDATFADPDGRRTGMNYFIPRSVEDLTKLRRFYELVSMETGGFFGRFTAIMTLWHAYSMDPTAIYQKYNPAWLENMQRSLDKRRVPRPVGRSIARSFAAGRSGRLPQNRRAAP